MNVSTYTSNLDITELIRRISLLVAHQHTVEHLLCRYLADLADRFDERRRASFHDFSELDGYSDVYHAARRLFGMGVRRARERVRIGVALRELPVIESAFVAGELAYSRVREITRVAKSSDEGQWITLARHLPMRQLEQRVAEAGDGDGFRERISDKTREPAALQWRSADVVDVHLTMRAEAWAQLERAMEGARVASDLGPDGMLSDSEALEAVARDAIAHQQAATADSAADPRRVVVLYECKSCERTEIDTGAGAVPLDEAGAAALGCCAKERDLDREGRIVKRGGAVPSSVVRAVRLRDRNRCRNPGCNRRRYVDIHHIRSREIGGAHARANLCCLCTTCHRKLHDRKLSIEGDADGELIFFDAAGERITSTHDPIGSQPNVALMQERTAADQKLLDVMRARGSWHPDALVTATGLGISQVNIALVRLEVAGLIRGDINGRYHPA